MFADLNPAQRQAVATLRGPLLVLAGAGTGKTRVITYRIANLIRHGVAPQRILGVTFTNKAAREMQQRAAALLGKQSREKPEISTFHSLCVRLLRRQIGRLGYPTQFAIYDRGDQESLARTVLRELRVDNATMKPGDLLSLVSRWKNQSLRPPDAAAAALSDQEHLAASGYRKYQQALQAAGALDFDDLLLCTQTLLADHPDVLDAEAARFDHLLIDEYQDTNGPQYRIVKALAMGHRNLCVVGDDDQSIYAWRGAEVSHILNFTRDWPEATVIRLEENYRSRGPILELANTLIRFNTQRYDKVLRPSRSGGETPRVRQFEEEEEEARGVVTEIRTQIETKFAQPGDYAILFRTNEQPRAFEQELRRQQIPYQLVGGQSFFDRKEVKDLLCYLRVLIHPRDEVSLLRIINTPPRGLGPAVTKALLDRAVAAGKPVWEMMADAETLDSLAAKPREAVAAFRDLIGKFRRQLQQASPAKLLEDLVAAVDYKAEILRTYKEAEDQESRWRVVEEVVNAAAAYEASTAEPNLAEFLDQSALADRDDERFRNDKGERNAVTLMTLHSAKGLEFPIVYLVGMEEEVLPHKRSLAEEGDSLCEERRLCYVGITRAIERLTLTFCKQRRKWGKLRPRVPSRFLFEMRGDANHPVFLKAKAAVADYERNQRLRHAKRSRTKNARPRRPM